MMGYEIDWKSPLVSPVISAITALIVVFISTLIIPHIRAKQDRNRRARYLAIRVVCVLDKYVAQCATVSGDEGEPDQEGIYHDKYKMPDPPTYPTDVDWHSIDHELMYALQSLPAEAERASNYVADAAEHADWPDFEQYYEARSEEMAKLALNAHKLTGKLRKAYSIPELKYEFWSPIDYAQKQLDELKARKEKRAKLYADAAAKLDIPPPPPPAAT